MGEFKTEEKLVLLQEFFDCASWLGKKVFFCQKGCATCCTQSVTISSLEGELICKFMERKGDLGNLVKLLSSTDTKPYRPSMTTNQFARSCIEKHDIAPEEGEWSFEPCVFLDKGICQIYEVRPFSCRAFVSLSDCQKEGTASVPPVIMTLNTLLQQIIEQLSHGGCWGNMLDVLPNILLQREIIEKKSLPRESVIIAAELIPGFLVPVTERPIVQKYLDEIGHVLQNYIGGEIHEEVKSIQKLLAQPFSTF